MRSPVYAVLVAAGSGVRLGAGVPKALVELAGRPLVWRAVDALVSGGCERIVVVVPASQIENFAAAVRDYPHVELVAGGARRQDSVRAGLAALGADDDAVVLIHDAARPIVPARLVHRVADAVRAGAEAVVPVVAVTDSIRQIAPTGATTVVDRETLRAVQTPQGFRAALLVRAHDMLVDQDIEVTDDAAAVEFVGAHITLVAGEAEAIKVTEPLDLVIADEILRGRS